MFVTHRYAYMRAYIYACAFGHAVTHIHRDRWAPGKRTHRWKSAHMHTKQCKESEVVAAMIVFYRHAFHQGFGISQSATRKHTEWFYLCTWRSWRLARIWLFLLYHDSHYIEKYKVIWIVVQCCAQKIMILWHFISTRNTRGTIIDFENKRYRDINQKLTGFVNPRWTCYHNGEFQGKAVSFFVLNTPQGRRRTTSVGDMNRLVTMLFKLSNVCLVCIWIKRSQVNMYISCSTLDLLLSFLDRWRRLITTVQDSPKKKKNLWKTSRKDEDKNEWLNDISESECMND